MDEYLKAFIIGSSLPVFIWYFYVVSNYSNTIRTFSYENYTFIAPLFLGILNVFGLFISQKYNLNRFTRFILTGLIGATLVSIFITAFKVYNFPDIGRWIKQYIGLYITYLIIYGLVVNLIDYAMA